MTTSAPPSSPVSAGDRVFLSLVTPRSSVAALAQRTGLTIEAIRPVLELATRRRLIYLRSGHYYLSVLGRRALTGPTYGELERRACPACGRLLAPRDAPGLCPACQS